MIYKFLQYDASNFRVNKGGYYARQKQLIRDRLVLAGDLEQTVCAVGDSVTAGPEWDDVLFGYYPGIIPTTDMGVGGDTSKEMLSRINTILATNADLYILAIGINDIRHNDALEPGAITTEDYISTVGTAVDTLRENADVIVLSIWPAWTDDSGSVWSIPSTNAMINERNNALMRLCMRKGILFSNATKTLREAINTVEKERLYSADGLHPNETGRALYADAIIYDEITA